MKKNTIFVSAFLLLGILLSSCSGINAAVNNPGSSLAGTSNQSQPVVQAATPLAEAAPVQPVVIDSGLLAAYENALSDIYDGVNPSVVSISAVLKADSSQLNLSQFPGSPQDQTPQYSQVQGSGFVWDDQGHIVTNNHVVSGAEKIEVMFSDGTIVPATLVGADVYSDLAVLKVEVAKNYLQPVQLANSDEIKVGQLAIAIGNPFGFENTMTVGIVSAIGRTIPAGEQNPFGSNYSIPDIIQTDAPINPGNSGGVLVNDKGQVMGVTAAIESTVNANVGIGFAIPSYALQQVVPVLIEKGNYEHPYLGLSGTTLTPDLAKAMDLAPEQRGALVIEVSSGTPAEKGGVLGSSKQVTINGQQAQVGGDVITAIDGTVVRGIDDLIAYLGRHTEVGQKVTLTVLRDGKPKDLEIVLEARPAQQTASQTAQSQSNGKVFLGILGQTMSAQIATAMNLPETQTGVLIEQVEAGSPAEKAGLRGSETPVTIQGQEMLVGGDVITAFDGNQVNTFQDLVTSIQGSTAGQVVKLTILRDGKTLDVSVTLAGG